MMPSVTAKNFGTENAGPNYVRPQRTKRVSNETHFCSSRRTKRLPPHFLDFKDH